MEEAKMRFRVRVAALAGLIFALAPAAAPAADRMLLWQIVTLKCLRHELKSEAPIPCDYIDMAAGESRGVAALKGFDGPAGMLTIPLARVTGIEDAALQAPDAPNYFAAAWATRGRAEFHAHRPFAREDLAIAVDSKPAREQDQLNLRLDCIDKTVASALRGYAGPLDAQWREMEMPLKGRRYWARTLDSSDLADSAPFRLMAGELPGAESDLADWSLAAIGALRDGKPGFVLLANKVDATGGGRASDLLDRECGGVASTQ
jgi:CDP-diacylglycerol pyrophosphatase